MSPSLSLSLEERDELRSTARGLLDQASPSARVREVVAEEPGFDRDLWRQMIELGWTSIHVPEALGGSGVGLAEVAVVLHELGRAMVPSPFLASAVLATGALVGCENAALADATVPALVDGSAVGAVAFASADGSYAPARSTMTWERAGGGVRCAGTSGFVLDADVADTLVVAARSTDGLTALLALDASASGASVLGASTSGLRIERTASVDETRRLFTVLVDDVVVDEGRLLCEPGPRTEELIDRILALGVLAAACDATGAAEQVLERSTEYAKERVQFGKPIGSFQAVKHHCANMAAAVEPSRYAVRAAADAFDSGASDWARRAGVLASFVGPACVEACALGMRVYGGIGFTWEHDSHMYVKRAKLDEVLFGTPSWHRRRLADAVMAPRRDREGAFA